MFAGRAFVKEDILKALRLGHSQANSDANLFKQKVLDKLPKLQEWYNNPDGPQAKRFSNMTVKEYGAYVERKLTAQKKAGQKRSSSNGGDGDLGRPPKKAKKQKEPEPFYMDSEDIDGSSEGSSN